MKTRTSYLPQLFITKLEDSFLSDKQKSVCISIFNTLLCKFNPDNDSKFFPLSSVILQDNYGKDYRKCLTFLIDSEIVECNYSYHQDSCRKYKLNYNLYKLDNNLTHYVNFNYKKTHYKKKEVVTEISDERDIPEIEKKTKLITPLSYTYRSKRILKKTLYLLRRLKVDNKVFEYINSLDCSSIVKGVYMNRITNLQHHKLLYCHRNLTNKRLDTNLTNLKKEFLDFITLDGERLSEIDLSNSQILLTRCFIDYIYKHTPKETINHSQYQHFTKLCNEGQFYEFLLRKLNLVSTDKNRTTIKKEVLIVLFSKNFVTSQTGRIMRRYISSILKCVEAFKFANGYKEYPIYLQLKESELFIDNILRLLLNKDFRLLSKHDSILCKESDFNKVKEIIDEKLTKVFGENNYNLKYNHRELVRRQNILENEQSSLEIIERLDVKTHTLENISVQI